MEDDKGNGGLVKYVDNQPKFVIDEVRKILVYAKKQGITNIVLLGDLFETPRGSYCGQLELIKLFADNPKFMFRAILGNHDRQTKLYNNIGHSMEIILAMNITNFKLYLEPTVEIIDGSKIHWMPWPCKTFKKDCLNIAHVEVNGASYDSGQRKFENTKDTDPEHMLSNSSAIAVLGHLHTMHAVRNMTFVGTCYQTCFGEKIDKYFAHVKFSTPEDYEIILVPHKPNIRLFNLIVNSKADLENISTDPNDLYKLIISEGSDINIADYNHMQNVVQIKAFKNKQELQTLLTEDLTSNNELEIKTSDFFNSYIDKLDIDANLKKRSLKLRTNLLTGN